MESVGQARWDFDGWREQAACRSQGPQLFFPAGVTGLAETQIASAKRVCGGCPVQEDCLEFALRTGQEYGVWGGASEDERRAMRRARRAAARLRPAS